MSPRVRLPGDGPSSEGLSRRGPRPLPLLDLGRVFLRLGATAFGGLGAALALIERELVDRRRVLRREDVTEALTYTKLLPGSTVLQVVSYLGFRLGGWTGSAVATVAFVLPSALLMLVLSAGYLAATSLPAFGPALAGLSAAVVGVLLATTYRLGRANVEGPLTAGIALVAFAAGAFFGTNAALVVVAAGLLGVVLLSAPPPGAAPETLGDDAQKEGGSR